MPDWSGGLAHAVAAAGLTTAVLVGVGAAAVSDGADAPDGQRRPTSVVGTDTQGHYLGAGAPIWKTEMDGAGQTTT
ncbi:hypothetical protein GCM10018790_63180 [Kitasatospora xanthocidica]|uniref:hypothetical protein n=1 Tax=Kitasatospora xanthocidica TaxID=83382 RepID=UPI0016795995|nr:hypothetical protein [Kitasatospora xanthocidica]GHF76524.1 hypothetical protein GCM10018790_63180 [Kitasatospora xanthocidica]